MVRVRRSVGEVDAGVDARVEAHEADIVEHDADARRGDLHVSTGDRFDARVAVAGYRVDVVLVPIGSERDEATLAVGRKRPRLDDAILEERVDRATVGQVPT